MAEEVTSILAGDQPNKSTAHHRHSHQQGHVRHTMDIRPSSGSESMLLPGRQNTFRLAVSATVHCLIGCGVGEVAGMIFAAALDLSLLDSMILSIVSGFVAGIGLGIVPLRRNGFTLSNAFKTVVVAEGLSIAVMEAFEVASQALIPGVMDAGLKDMTFWIGMVAGLSIGFVAALPVNYVMVRRGIRHQH